MREDIVYNYDYEIKATKKITAKGNTSVESGKKVSFITGEEGLIVLLPGFRAMRGSNFSAYMTDLSEYSRICPDTLCETVRATTTYGPAFGMHLELNDLLYAVKIEYEIFDDEQGRFIYGDTLKITRNGRFILWDCRINAILTQCEVFYWLYCTIYYCNGMKSYLMQKFLVENKYNFWGCGNPWWKSSTEESGEQYTPPQFPSPNPNNTPPQSATIPPHFTIIPNPNSGTFQLEINLSLSEISNLKISNLMGVPVYEAQNVTEHTIQLQNSASGMFFVVIILKDGTMLTQKMVVNR